MRLIAIESATDACSAALYIDGEVHQRFKVAPQQHAKLLLPWLSQLLSEAELNPAQLDGLAVGRGPGSFTGVRIGISIVQGIAYARDLPVALVSTLQATAVTAREQQPQQLPMIVALDARMDEIYCGAYSGTADAVDPLWPETVCPPERLTPPPGRWHGVGIGFERYRKSLAVALGESLVDTQPDCLPSAKAVATIGAGLLERGDGVAAERVQPVYLRDRVTRTP